MIPSVVFDGIFHRLRENAAPPDGNVSAFSRLESSHYSRCLRHSAFRLKAVNTNVLADVSGPRTAVMWWS